MVPLELKMAMDKLVWEHLGSLKQQPGSDRQVVAFFDMDRTLIVGFSALAVVWESIRRRRSGMIHIGREMLVNIDRGGGGQRYINLYLDLLKSMAGTDESAFRELGELAFAHSLEASIYREARQIVRLHKQLGHKVVIVSAATNYQVEPIARALGIDEVLCTRLEVAEGKLTGAIVGELCYGEGKLNAARTLLKHYRARQRDAWFYSDSADDLPLLKKVGYPVVTNPSPALADYANQAGWRALKFSSRGKPNLESVVRTALMTNTLVSTAAGGAASWFFSRSPKRATNLMTSWLGGIGSAFAGLEIEVEGRAHLESVRPAIFTFNHQSNLDSVVMAYLLQHDVVAFCKKELADHLLLGPLLKAHGTIFVDREAADQSLCLEQAKAALLAGKSLAIAPEGTRSASGELLDFKHGAFYLAKKLKLPIVPVVLHNVADALPKGSLWLRPATIRVTVLPPLLPENLGNLRQSIHGLRQDYQAVMDAEWGGAQIAATHTRAPVALSA
ncbi:MAG: putative phosphoserine phosphatase/1-acylglycerol-3-phosphate O-acyltransferase [Halioglobus sp.]